MKIIKSVALILILSSTTTVFAGNAKGSGSTVQNGSIHHNVINSNNTVNNSVKSVSNYRYDNRDYSTNQYNRQLNNQTSSQVQDQRQNQKQQQSQGQNQQANGGNSANSISNIGNSSVESGLPPAPPAVAPTMIGMPGSSSFSGGLSTPFGGVSFGSSTTIPEARRVLNAQATAQDIENLKAADGLDPEQRLRVIRYIMRRYR